MDQRAHVLLVLIGTVQGTDDDLTQHLWQEMLRRFHVSHAVRGFSQVLAAQVVRHDGLLGQGTNHQSPSRRRPRPRFREEQSLCSQSFSAAPPWREGASCLSSGASPGWEEGWSSGQAVEAETQARVSDPQTQRRERRRARGGAYLSQRRGLGARGLGAGGHHAGDLRLQLGDLVLAEEERLRRPEADLLDQKTGSTQDNRVC